MTIYRSQDFLEVYLLKAKDLHELIGRPGKPAQRRFVVEALAQDGVREGDGMRLVSVYERPDTAKILYDLLSEREPRQNISHRWMPSFEEHCAFLRSKPYQGWYLIEDWGVPIGSVCLSKQDEIGIFIFKAHQGKGWGARAIAALKRLHPRPRYLANIAIPNAKSLAFFTKQGFHVLSVTMGRSLWCARHHREGLGPCRSE